jgi:DNA (cytosine-5)-methyltransferase 1
MREALPVLSAFSGAGGLDLGLERAGFQTLGCLEVNKNARATLQHNRPAWRLLHPSDVVQAGKQLSPGELGLRRGDLAVLAAGPPCQPFSKAAQWSATARTGMADDRGKTIHGLLDLAERFLPYVILLENVPGFVRGADSALPVIQHRLEEINRYSRTRYRLQHVILDAADYGVPQRRHRAIGIACRNGRVFQWPAPTHHDALMRCWDAIGAAAEPSPPYCTGKWTGLLPSIPEGRNYLWHTAVGGGEPLFGYRTRFWSFLLKLARDQPAWTLPASPGPSTGPFHWDNRPLSVSERLLLQSFPTSWSLAGEPRSQVRLAGNATPPLLAEVVGRVLADQLFGMSPSTPLPTLLLSKAATVPPAAPPQPVPVTYLHLRGAHPAHPGAGRGPAPRRPHTPALEGAR